MFVLLGSFGADGLNLVVDIYKSKNIGLPFWLLYVQTSRNIILYQNDRVQ